MGLRWKGGERGRNVPTHSDYTHWRKGVEEEDGLHTERDVKQLSGERKRKGRYFQRWEENTNRKGDEEGRKEEKDG
ncbi:hypothetical protein CesoFtcFv8_005827 [Champsocephalus esox]|uniref:Uncharacterized protein n=1 Tax=Champsocephalus esox TaxID=159716 RepID=A0AAN8CMR8_9TELE|nr:hypothetical protein CesoFtcFv8_005827 [Champsocephalus esox]